MGGAGQQPTRDKLAQMTTGSGGPRPVPISFDTGTPVVVLKVGRYALHHGGLGAIRTLGRVGVPVYGVHEDRLAPAAASRYLAGKFIWMGRTSPPCLLPSEHAVVWGMYPKDGRSFRI